MAYLRLPMGAGGATGRTWTPGGAGGAGIGAWMGLIKDENAAT
jgi:hypothetical protein